MSTTKKEFTGYKLANVDRAFSDQRLTDLTFRVLWGFATAANWQTEISRRQQTDIAKTLGRTTRAMRKCLDRLVEFEYLVPIGAKPGKYISAYNVLGAKSGTCVPVAAEVNAGNGKAERAFPKAERAFQKQERPFRHSTFNPVIFPSDHSDTEQGGPRLRAVALGPPPEGETGQGLGNGATELPDDPPQGPLGPLDVERLRQRIGPDEFTAWIDKLRFVELADDTLTLAASNRFIASQIGPRYERPLLECTPGQPTRLDVVVRQ